MPSVFERDKEYVSASLEWRRMIVPMYHGSDAVVCRVRRFSLLPIPLNARCVDISTTSLAFSLWRYFRFQALLTDMYQVTMSYAYWKAGRHDEHVRKPARSPHRLLAENIQQCIIRVHNVVTIEQLRAATWNTLRAACKIRTAAVFTIGTITRGSNPPLLFDPGWVV